MSCPTSREKAIRHFRDQATQAAADHQHLTLVRNRFIAGTATREEIFLAINTAATQMLLFSQTAHTLAEITAISYHVKEEEPPTRQKRQPPPLQLITGGKGSTEPTPRRKPRKRGEAKT